MTEQESLPKMKVTSEKNAAPNINGLWEMVFVNFCEFIIWKTRILTLRLKSMCDTHMTDTIILPNLDGLKLFVAGNII